MIVLDQRQTDIADGVAILRRAFALRKSREQIRGLERMSELERLMLDVIGCRAELAAHLLFGIEWKSAFSEEPIKDGDIAGFVDVKGVARPKDRLLIKEERGHPEHAYLLIDGTFHPAWYPIGWIWGAHAMVEEYRGNFGGGQGDCFIVPRSSPPLRPVRELSALVKEALA